MGMSTINMELVKKLMKINDVDVKKMAQLIEVTPPTVKRFLNSQNKKQYSSIFVYRVARALGVSMESIVISD